MRVDRMKTGMWFGTFVSMLAIVLSPFAFADSNRYVNQFNPFGGETGTLYSGNVASTFAVDSNPIVVNETVIYDAPVIQHFAIPNSDVGTDAWGHFGCTIEAYTCIDDDPLTDGDGDTTYIWDDNTLGLPTGVGLSGNIPSDALIVPSEPFLLVRARLRDDPGSETNTLNVDVYWRWESNPPIFCDTIQLSIASTSYVNYGQSLPNCEATDSSWNATMLNTLELIFTIDISDTPFVIRITMAYVRIHYRNVLYSAAIGWSFEFLAVQAQLINRIVWNCTHTGDLPLSLGILTPPSPASRSLVAATMCEGSDEDSFSPLYASDIDGDVGSIVVIISGTNTTVSPGFFSLDQIIIVQNGTRTTSILDFGGPLCWLLGIALVFIAMITVIVIKRRKGRNGSIGRNG